VKNNPTLYDILRVSKNAPPEVIKKSYESLVMEYADKYRGRSDVDLYLNTLFDAYSVLKDPERRRKYDLHLPKENIAFWKKMFQNKQEPISPKDFAEKSPTFTQLLDFDWEALEPPINPIKNETPEKRKAFWDALGFKVIILLLFLILMVLVFWASK